MSVFPGRFEGRCAIVTGGASGLGKQVAARIVAEGGKVALWDLNADALDATKDEIGSTSWSVRPASPARPLRYGIIRSIAGSV